MTEQTIVFPHPLATLCLKEEQKYKMSDQAPTKLCSLSVNSHYFLNVKMLNLLSSPRACHSENRVKGALTHCGDSC